MLGQDFFDLGTLDQFHRTGTGEPGGQQIGRGAIRFVGEDRHPAFLSSSSRNGGHRLCGEEFGEAESRGRDRRDHTRLFARSRGHGGGELHPHRRVLGPFLPSRALEQGENLHIAIHVGLLRSLMLVPGDIRAFGEQRFHALGVADIDRKRESRVPGAFRLRAKPLLVRIGPVLQ